MTARAATSVARRNGCLRGGSVHRAPRGGAGRAGASPAPAGAWRWVLFFHATYPRSPTCSKIVTGIKGLGYTFVANLRVSGAGSPGAVLTTRGRYNFDAPPRPCQADMTGPCRDRHARPPARVTAGRALFSQAGLSRADDLGDAALLRVRRGLRRHRQRLLHQVRAGDLRQRPAQRPAARLHQDLRPVLPLRGPRRLRGEDHPGGPRQLRGHRAEQQPASAAADIRTRRNRMTRAWRASCCARPWDWRGGGVEKVKPWMENRCGSESSPPPSPPLVRQRGRCRRQRDRRKPCSSRTGGDSPRPCAAAGRLADAIILPGRSITVWK